MEINNSLNDFWAPSCFTSKPDDMKNPSGMGVRQLSAADDD